MTTRYHQAKKITIVGAIVDTLLGFLKIIGGIFAFSHALVADGVHSFSDLVMYIMVIFAAKHGSKAADQEHPYGHQRIETAATLFLSLLLVFAGFGIAWDSLNELKLHNTKIPSLFALPIAIISILAKEILYHYTLRVGKEINSQLIIANAWHHRSDAASSIVVTIGLLGTGLGFNYLDPIAAIIIGLMIIKMGINYGWNSVKELVDTAVEPETFTRINDIITSVSGVKKIHQLRSRYMGNDILIDVHILVDPFISVSEGHHIAHHVHRSLIKQLLNVRDVTVHVDPEDDELSSPSHNLESRGVLQEEFLTKWQKDYPVLQSWVIHYINGNLIIDLICYENKLQLQALYKHIKTEANFHHLKKRKISEIRLLTKNYKITDKVI